MENINDYLIKYGNLTFVEKTFNEIDYLILARLSYIPFESILKTFEKETIGNLYTISTTLEKDSIRYNWPTDILFLKLMGESKRFKDLIISDFVYILDKEEENQFAAIMIHLDDGINYISYRGTDSTFVGWKEDFYLSFKTHINSQVSAKKYLEKVAKKYPNNNFILGGHSKGGNIAIYASAFCKDDIKNRILSIVNYDGPGFMKEVIESKEYNSILDIITTIVPQNSIIGRCMYHKGDFIIVESTQTGIMQHDVYSWNIDDDRFVYMDDLTKQSDFVDNTITKWIEVVDSEQRKQIIDVIFDILYRSDYTNFYQLTENWIDSARYLTQKYHNLDEETKKIILNTFKELLRSARSNIDIKRRLFK